MRPAAVENPSAMAYPNLPMLPAASATRASWSWTTRS